MMQARQAKPSISIRSAVIQLGLFALLGTAIILFYGDGPEQETVSITLIYITYAAAWNIVAGYGGQFTFGHAEFFGIGAYAATLFTIWIGLPPFFGIWIGVVVAALTATGIGLITLKLRGLYFGLVTAVFPIVFAVVFTYLGFQEVSVPFNPNAGLAYFMPDDPRVLSGAALAAALLVGVVTVVLVRSKFGLFLGALRADQDAAEASGVATTRMKIYALALSAGLSAIAGGLYASAALVVTPADTFGAQMSVKPVLFSVFGGIGTLMGPVVGAAVLVPLSEALTAHFGASLPGLSGLVYGGSLLLVITLFPAGLVPVISGFVRRQMEGGAAVRTISEHASALVPDEARVVALPGGPPILEVHDVSKAFGGTRVLVDVSFQVERGEILGVIGPNGAGKTTLFNIINGFLKSDAGRIRLSGQDVTLLRPSLIAQAGIGRTFQTARVFTNMSVIENVMVPAAVRCAHHAEAHDSAVHCLAEVGLSEQAHLPVDGLTTGELRRLELARAMATAGPRGLLLLDEFLGGLNAADSGVLLASLRRYRAGGGSVLAIEHTMRAMAGFVDRFVVLDFGKVIAQGLPEEIWRNREVVKAYLGDKWVA